MRFPVRLVRGGWPGRVESLLARFVRQDPKAILSSDVSPDTFRRIVSSLHVGDTIKITGENRHPVADDLLVNHVDLTGRTIVDIGASDGTTSFELINKLPNFGSYVIADLYLYAKYRQAAGHLFIYDSAGTCVMVAGRRLVAWPAQSRVVGAVYRPLIARAARESTPADLLLLNPQVTDLMRRDTRVSCRVHDVFTEWSGPKPDVIKVANLLRRLYFSDVEITRGLAALHRSLPVGGYLLMVDNPRIPGISARAGLYRRSERTFEQVQETSDVPEIGDLIAAFEAE